MYKNKNLYALVEISQLLTKLKFTYKETDELIKSMQNHYRELRDNIEIEPDKSGNSLIRAKSADNDLVESMNHVEPYC